MVDREYRTQRKAYGHVLLFEGGEGFAGIDVSYDGGPVVDRIGTFDHATETSSQADVTDFESHVAEYLGDLTEEDAHLHATGGRNARPASAS